MGQSRPEWGDDAPAPRDATSYKPLSVNHYISYRRALRISLNTTCRVCPKVDIIILV